MGTPFFNLFYRWLTFLSLFAFGFFLTPFSAFALTLSPANVCSLSTSVSVGSVSVYYVAFDPSGNRSGQDGSGSFSTTWTSFFNSSASPVATGTVVQLDNSTVVGCTTIGSTLSGCQATGHVNATLTSVFTDTAHNPTACPVPPLVLSATSTQATSRLGVVFFWWLLELLSWFVAFIPLGMIVFWGARTMVNNVKQIFK